MHKNIPPMNVKLKLRPGDRGTKKLVAKFGSKLLCVRYRYDVETQRRLKTIELIVDDVHWTPKHPVDSPVFLRINKNEKDIHEEIKSAGGRWSNKRKLWILDYDTVKSLGLISRIWRD